MNKHSLSVFFMALLAAPLSADRLTGVNEGLAVASQLAAADAAGSAVAILDDLTVVGSPQADPLGVADAGSVTVFRRGPAGSGDVEEATLVASDASAESEFGVSLAVTPDTIFVGAWRDGAAGTDAGAVYVFARAGSQWIETQKILALDGQAGDGFGGAVAASGSTLLVGARFEDEAGDDAGAAYVFEPLGGLWSQQAKLLAPDAGLGDELGAALALDGDTALVGAPLDNTVHGADNGSAYVFVRDDDAWIFQAKLRQGATNDRFGSAVALDGDGALCGGDEVAFLFRREGNAWSEEQLLRPRVGQGGLAGYGRSVALSGAVALVGAPAADNERGSVAIYKQQGDGAEWRQQGLIAVGDLGAHARFGEAVALSGQRVVVGAPGSDVAGAGSGTAAWSRIVPGAVCTQETAKLLPDPIGGAFGASVAADQGTVVVGSPDVSPRYESSVFVYTRQSGGLALQAELVPDGPRSGFGTRVSVQGDTLVATYSEDDPFEPDAGVYVFTRTGSTWSQEARLPIDRDLHGDPFAVVVDQDTIALALPLSDGAASASGAVEVFVRAGTTWTTQALLIASDASPDLGFGTSIALEGDVLLVGAHTLKPFMKSGAAYAFRRNGTTWTEEAKLTDPGGGFTRFGDAVAFSRSTGIVGAPHAENRRGVAWVYERSGTSWTLRSPLTPLDSESGDRFGSRLALDGERLLVAAPNDDRIGTVFAFVRSGHSGPGWIQQQELVPSDTRQPFPWIYPFEDLALDADVAVLGRPLGAYVYELEQTFPSFCDAADGSLASCPCANPGSPDTGCNTPQGTGGVRLDVLAQRRAPIYRATLTGSGFPAAGAPTVIAIRSATLDASAPIVLGDGLRCLGLPLMRLGATTAGGGQSLNAVTHPPAMQGAFHYQLWFRSNPAMACTPAAFNLSNGRTLTW